MTVIFNIGFYVTLKEMQLAMFWDSLVKKVRAF
jgi:hypothetical protein